MSLIAMHPPSGRQIGAYSLIVSHTPRPQLEQLAGLSWSSPQATSREPNRGLFSLSNTPDPPQLEELAGHQLEQLAGPLQEKFDAMDA